MIGLAGGERLRALTLEGRQAGERLGSAMAVWAPAGGGTRTLLISAPSFDGRAAEDGRVVGLQLSGVDEAGMVELPFVHLLPRGKLGLAMSADGDFDGDGMADLAVGIPYQGGAQRRAGGVGVLAGWSVPALLLESPEAKANLGAALDAVGDVNGDGFDDLVVGAPTMTVDYHQEGVAWLHLGSPEGLRPQAAWQVRGGRDGARLGENIRAAGDVNGDGLADVLVAAPRWAEALPGHGEVRLYLGCPEGLAPEPAWIHRADRPYSVLGRGLGRAVDLNFDGLADVVLGLPGLPEGKVPRGGGLVHVFFGRPGGLPSVPDVIWEGPVERDGFGATLCLVGDMNGDGFPELAVGAPFSRAAGREHGLLRVFPGTFAGFSMIPALQISGGSPGGRYGWMVGAVGDLDGDGLADLGIGSPHFLSRNQAHGRCDVVFGGRGLGGPPTALEALRDPAFVRAGPDSTLALVSEWRRPPPEVRHTQSDREVEVVPGHYSLVLVGLGALAALAYLARRSARNQLQAIRGRLHDFVGSELSGIKPTDPGLRRVIEELRAVVWIVKHERPPLPGLVAQLADWAVRFASERGLSLRLELPTEPLGADRVDPRVAEAAHAAVRVALANVVEHAHATRAVLRLRARGDHLVVEIEDNGVGIGSMPDLLARHPSGISGSRGLAGLRARLEPLGGDLALEPGLAAGTRVTVQLPVRARARFRIGGPGFGLKGWSGPRQPSSPGPL